MAKPFIIWLNSLSDGERLDAAAERLNEVRIRVNAAISLFEHNRKFVFDEAFDREVPSSEARAMFQFVQHTLVRSLILEVCKIWDSPRDSRDSLPTIHALLNKPAVLDLQRERQIQRFQHFRNLSPAEVDPELDTWLKSTAAGNDDGIADERIALLKDTLPEVERVFEKSTILPRLREFRDRNIAHSLSTKPRREDWPFYGDAGDLLSITEPLMTNLMQTVCYGSPSWDEYHRIAREQAHFLWNGCRFAVASNEGL